MCINCWTEGGSPSIISEKTIAAAKLVTEVYEHDGGAAGGFGHIVFDDWNLDDGDIDFCIEESKKSKTELATVCLEALTAFKNMTEEERYSAIALFDGYLEPMIKNN